MDHQVAQGHAINAEYTQNGFVANVLWDMKVTIALVKLVRKDVNLTYLHRNILPKTFLITC